MIETLVIHKYTCDKCKKSELLFQNIHSSTPPNGWSSWCWDNSTDWRTHQYCEVCLAWAEIKEKKDKEKHKK